MGIFFYYFLFVSSFWFIDFLISLLVFASKVVIENCKPKKKIKDFNIHSCLMLLLKLKRISHKNFPLNTHAIQTSRATQSRVLQNEFVIWT